MDHAELFVRIDGAGYQAKLQTIGQIVLRVFPPDPEVSDALGRWLSGEAPAGEVHARLRPAAWEDLGPAIELAAELGALGHTVSLAGPRREREKCLAGGALAG